MKRPIYILTNLLPFLNTFPVCEMDDYLVIFLILAHDKTKMMYNTLDNVSVNEMFQICES